jgi:hypothetical protein
MAKGHFGQFLCRIRNHFYSSLEFDLQIGDVHLIGHAISIADAFHIAALRQLLQTSQHRGASAV